MRAVFTKNREKGRGGDDLLLTAFDLLLIGISLVVFLAGFGKLKRSWRMGREEECDRDLKGFWGYLLGHRKILQNRRAGLAHMALFWGFLFSLLMGILPQLGLSLPPFLAGLLSLLSDLLGVGLLLGLLYFFLRRINSDAKTGPKRVILPVALLLVMVLSGFLTEGTRLSIMEMPLSWRTPMGGLLALAMPPSPILMQIMIRVHFFALLIFIAILPFSFMRHLISGSLNVAYRQKRPRGALREMDLSSGEPAVGAQTASNFTWKQLLDVQACVACGRCDDGCPATISGKPLSPRQVMGEIQDRVRLSPFSSLEKSVSPDALWACTTCMACVDRCPVLASPMDKLMDLRRARVMGNGLLPEAARDMMRNLEIYGDVNGRGPAHREDWAMHLGVPHISEEGLNAEILLWVGCSGAFHPRYQETYRAMVRILQAAGVCFGILGREESCCGDGARRLGDEALFRSLRKKNMAAFKKYHIRKIVCLCPHGYNTLKNEYPGDFEVVHGVPFVLELIKQQKIFLKYPENIRMAIHDPCYLGRVNGIYDSLREAAMSVPGIELRELARNRENALCCGGGGGRMWLHESIGQNINQLRAQEAAETGVNLVGTACPYCLTMLEDGINALEMEKPPRVMDLIEIIASAMGRVY
jgi:Fe-S oxidoreductase/nitrate reductase gamma subunit